MDHNHYGHRQRLKDRFLQTGFAGFDPHNILELLLFYSIPQKDTNDLAHELMNRFGSLSDQCQYCNAGKNDSSAG